MEFDDGPIKVGITVCTERPDLLCGCRVFVHWDSQPPGPLPVIDTNGQPLVNDFADGQEVEIIAWRPRARVGLSYHGSEWWIGAYCLRRQALAAVHDPTAHATRR